MTSAICCHCAGSFSFPSIARKVSAALISFSLSAGSGFPCDSLTQSNPRKSTICALKPSMQRRIDEAHPRKRSADWCGESVRRENQSADCGAGEA
jgi:hypothetical protein